MTKLHMISQSQLNRYLLVLPCFDNPPSMWSNPTETTLRLYKHACTDSYLSPLSSPRCTYEQHWIFKDFHKICLRPTDVSKFATIILMVIDLPRFRHWPQLNLEHLPLVLNLSQHNLEVVIFSPKLSYLWPPVVNFSSKAIRIEDCDWA